MKYQVLHVIPGFHSGNMVSRVVEFYDRYFSENHHFCLYSFTNVEPNQFNPSVSIDQRLVCINVKRLRECLAFIRYLDKYDIVAIHYMAISPRLQLIMMLFFRNMFKKMVWIEWGADLYEYSGFYSGSRILTSIYENFCRSVRSFVAIFEPDIAEYRKLFGNKNRIFCAPYSFAEKQDGLPPQGPTIKFHSFGDDGVRRVLVCHRCYALTDPIGSIEALSKYNKNNLSIVIPFGGGNPDYIAKAVERAHLLFGTNVELIEKYLSLENLIALVESVDVLVFNSKRQIALGTIYIAFLARKKVYLSEEGVMYGYFRNIGIPVGSVEQIQSMSYEEFISPVNMDKAVEYVKEAMDLEKSARKWNAIYDDIAASLGMPGS